MYRRHLPISFYPKKYDFGHDVKNKYSHCIQSGPVYRCIHRNSEGRSGRTGRHRRISLLVSGMFAVSLVGIHGTMYMVATAVRCPLALLDWRNTFTAAAATADTPYCTAAARMLRSSAHRCCPGSVPSGSARSYHGRRGCRSPGSAPESA